MLRYCFTCGNPPGADAIYCVCSAGPFCPVCWGRHTCVRRRQQEAGSLLADIELAELANGGSEFHTDWCRCDASVGQVCEYCVIWNTLKRVKKYLTSQTPFES